MRRFFVLFFALLLSLNFNVERVFGADPRDVTVTVRVSDNLSGPFMMQIAEDKNNPPEAVPYQEVSVVRTAADVLFVRVQDRALNWSAWVQTTVGSSAVIQDPPVSPTPTPTPTPTPSPTPTTSAPSGGGNTGGGGGGGGGGAVKQTALYFKIVDPLDSTKIWNKRGCVSIYSRDLSPQFLGTGCADDAGNINILAPDAKVSVRVYEFGYGDKYRTYLGEVGGDKFTLDASFFPGTTRYAVSVELNSASPTPTPTPTPSQTPTPTTSPTPTPLPTVTTPATSSPTPTFSPTPSSTPSPSPTPTATPSSSLASTKIEMTYSKVIPVNSYVNALTSAKSTLVTVKATTISAKVDSPLRLKVEKLSKGTSVSVSIKTPNNRTYALPISKVSGTTYTSPILNFEKRGTFLVSIKIGKTIKSVRITVR